MPSGESCPNGSAMSSTPKERCNPSEAGLGLEDRAAPRRQQGASVGQASRRSLPPNPRISLNDRAALVDPTDWVPAVDRMVPEGLVVPEDFLPKAVLSWTLCGKRLKAKLRPLS